MLQHILILPYMFSVLLYLSKSFLHFLLVYVSKWTFRLFFFKEISIRKRNNLGIFGLPYKDMIFSILPTYYNFLWVMHNLKLVSPQYFTSVHYKSARLIYLLRMCKKTHTHTELGIWYKLLLFLRSGLCNQVNGFPPFKEGISLVFPCRWYFNLNILDYLQLCQDCNSNNESQTFIIAGFITLSSKE